MKHSTPSTFTIEFAVASGAIESRLTGADDAPLLISLADAKGATLDIPEGALPDGGPAFLPESRILTVSGLKMASDLQPGDRVMTRDHGLQPIRKVEHCRFGWRALGLVPMLRPVEIAASAFGPDLPARTLRLAPDHGVAVNLAGTSEVAVVAAKKLSGCAGVSRSNFRDVTYLKLVFDQPELVNVEGLWCEASLASAMEPAEPVRDEIMAPQVAAA